ncbi:hypothetical protein AGMMS50212_00110 [Spirochaetia bacterium]|nr:hypothetical protein AGMMS50212_00110 [Spirochaetia bacterium]
MSFNDIAEFVSSRRKFGDLQEKRYLSNENLLKEKKGISDFSTCKRNISVITFAPGDILIGNIRPYFKKIFFSNCHGGCDADVLVIRAKEVRFREWLYCALSQDAFFDYIMSGATGTKMPRGDKDHILLYKINTPSDELLDKFIKFTQTNFEMIQTNIDEQNRLEILQQLFMSTLIEQAIL